jgi:LacI family transcriptional regulator
VNVRRAVTITDVARAAGVSIATVSRVVNGRPGVSEETASQVQRVIEDLGYESSLVARTLRSTRTNVIGFLSSDFEPFSAGVLQGATRAVRGTGYDLVLYSTGAEAGADSRGWEQRHLSRIGGSLTDGTILVTPWVTEVVSATPVVAVDPKASSQQLPTVVSENREGAVAAVEHLLELGHRRIGFVAGRSDLESGQQRLAGYRDALQAAGLPVHDELIVAGHYDPDTAAVSARQLLSLAEPPTAIVAANDLSAIRTVAVARELGLTVPEDLSVVGFDNIAFAADVAPPLTTVDQAIEQLGYEAVQLLIRLIEEPDAEPRHITLPTELIVRASTCPPATR